MQALCELSPRLRPKLWIELPEDVGQGDRQVELGQRVIKPCSRAVWTVYAACASSYLILEVFTR